MGKDFNDFMFEAFGKRPKRKPPMTTKLSAIDESMHFLDLCYLDILDDELRECESRFLSTFH